MTTWYTAHIELAERQLDDRFETMIGRLDGYRPLVELSESGWVGVRIELPAENLETATRGAIALVEAAGESVAIAVEVMSAQESNARRNFAPTPDLMSVSEVAAELGITRTAVQKMIDNEKFPSATKVGSAWVIARPDVLRRMALRNVEPKFDFGDWTLENLSLADVEDLVNLNDRLNAHYDLIGLWPTSGETLAQEQLLQVWLHRVGGALEEHGRMS